MASASIQHQQPAQRPQRRRKPDPQSIYQTYLYEARERGQRNAARATADRYGVSDDTVRRIVAKIEAAELAKAEQAASDLAYVPPPFADELAANRPQSAPSLTEATASADAEPELKARLLMSSVNEDAAVEPQTAQPQRRTAELGELPQEDAGSAAPGHATPDPLGAETPELPVDPLPPAVPPAPPDPPEREPWGLPEPEPAPWPTPEHTPWPEPEPTTPTAAMPKTAASYRSATPQRIVVRVPVERRGGAVAWLADRPEWRNQMLAWSIVAVLILLCAVAA